MKDPKWISAMVIFLLMTIIIPLISAGETQSITPFIEAEPPVERISIEVGFEPSYLKEIEFNGLSFVTAEGFSIPFNEGDAALPFMTRKVVVHPFAKDLQIDIRNSTLSPLLSAHPVAGVPRSTPYSEPEEILPDDPERYPTSPLTIAGQGFVRGYLILDIRFDPVFMTNEGLMTASEVIAELTFSIEEHTGDEVTFPFIRDSSVFRKDLENILMNPEDLERYPAMNIYRSMGPLESDDVQYVIITNTTKIGDGFKDLIDWKNSKGVPSRIVETSFIDDNYQGIDMAEKIRNFIKDAVATWDTEFILMGGDIGVVAYRGGYAKTYKSEQPSNACDLYFSDLDGSWNADNDTYWGETSDGTDLRPDVYVGRAPVQTVNELRIFVEKTLRYEMDPPPGYLDNSTFAGEYLDDTTNSSRGLDLIKDNLMPAGSNVTSMYDSDKGVFGNLNRPNFMGQVDQGASLIYHAGHCNWNVMSVGTAGLGNLYNSDVSGYQSDGKYGVLNTVGCIANKFDRDDSIVEKHVMDQDGGTVAGIGNSHYGWYAYGYPGFGPSEQYMYQMTDELFTNGITTMGGHFAEGKNNYVANSGSYNSARWLQIVLNLIGDPEATVRTAEPMELNVTMPNSTGKRFDGFPVEVRSENGTPLEGALVCLQKSDYYDYGLTNESGFVSFDFTTGKLDPLNITITAYNHRPFKKNLSLDLILPTILINGPPRGTTGDDLMINCTVLDEAGIGKVELHLVEENLTIGMVRDSLWWEGVITIPDNSTDDIPYMISAYDRSGNLNMTGLMKIHVRDNDIPTIIEDRTHFDAYTGDMFEFAGMFDDNIGVESVVVRHWSGIEDPITTDMNETEGIWTGSYRSRTDITGKRYYRFIVQDHEGNQLMTEHSTYVVTDNDRPHELTDLSDTNGTTSDPFQIRASVKDNIAVSSVNVEWWYEGWSIHNNDTLKPDNDTYIHEMIADGSDLTPLKYILHARDESGNWNSTVISTITFTDNDPPVIIEDLTDGEVTSGDKISFSMKVSDNIAINNVKVFYRYQGTDETMISLDHGTGNMWGTTIPVPLEVRGDIEYRFRSTDTSGLSSSSAVSSILIRDGTDPTIDDIIYPSSVNAGSYANITVRATDNVGLGEIILEWWFGGMAPTEEKMYLSENGYSTSILIPKTAFGSLYILIHIEDISGNKIESDRKAILIIEYVEQEKKEKEPRIPLEGEDIDTDGMDDHWEYDNGLDLETDDSEDDPDADGYSNLIEFEHGTDPRDPDSHPDNVNGDNGQSLLIPIIIMVILVVLILGVLIAGFSMRREEETTSTNQPDMMRGPHHHAHISHDHAVHTSHEHSQHHHEDNISHSYPLEGDAISHPHTHPTHKKD